MKHLALAFSKLESSGFTLSLKKCCFAFQELQTLGHNISGLQITISDNHLTAVRNWPIPREKKAVQCFLGFANYHLEKVKDLAILTAPLYALIKKMTP
jgi:hypothetical protein